MNLLLNQYTKICQRIFLCVLLFPSLSFGQADYKHSIKSLREDFRILRGALEESHPGIYWYRTKAEMDGYFDEAWLSLSREMTELEYFRIVAPLISKIGCGHTWIATSKTTQHKLWEEGNVLPLELKFIGRKAYCFQNNSLDSISIQPGNEILSINNYSIDSLLILADKFSQGDGFIETGKRMLISRVFNQFYTLCIGQPDQYIVKFTNKNGDIRRISMEAINLKSIELVSNRRYPPIEKIDLNNIELQFLGKTSVALLRIKEFSDWKSDGKKIIFKSRLRECFRGIDSAKSDNLVIDLRDNGGGNERLALNLYSYLTDKPFIGYKQIDFRTTHFHYRKYSNTSLFEYMFFKLVLRHKKVADTTYLLMSDKDTREYRPYSHPFKGKIYILINGRSFSTTSDFTAWVQSNKLATFVGEETGGSYFGNTSNYEFLITLPNTKIKVNIPIARYQTNVMENNNFGRGTIPDHKIVYDIDDFMNGVDKGMRKIYELIANK